METPTTPPPEGLAPETGSPVRATALVERDKYPKHFMGMNPQGFPCWTSYPPNALPCEAETVYELLNHLAKWEPSVKAIVYPASQVARANSVNDSSAANRLRRTPQSH